MYIEEIKRGLRGEIKKRENEQYCTCETNIRQMCKDVLAKIEEQESMLAEKDKQIAELKEVAEDACLERDDNSRVIDELESENRKLKRALWLARGYIMTLLNRDFQRLAYQCNNDDYKKNLLRRRNRYYELSEKCRAKAKEYK